MIKASLVINSYNSTARHRADSRQPKGRASAKAHGGFTIEMGDVKEWGDFATFQKHIADATVAVDLSTDPDPTFQVTYTTGKDVLRAGTSNGKLKGAYAQRR